MNTYNNLMGFDDIRDNEFGTQHGISHIRNSSLIHEVITWIQVVDGGGAEPMCRCPHMCLLSMRVFSMGCRPTALDGRRCDDLSIRWGVDWCMHTSLVCLCVFVFIVTRREASHMTGERIFRWDVIFGIICDGDGWGFEHVGGIVASTSASRLRNLCIYIISISACQ